MVNEAVTINNTGHGGPLQPGARVAGVASPVTVGREAGTGVAGHCKARDGRSKHLRCVRRHHHVRHLWGVGRRRGVRKLFVHVGG